MLSTLIHSLCLNARQPRKVLNGSQKFSKNFHRKILSNLLMVSDVSLVMQSDSKNYVSVQDDEITELVHTIKSARAWHLKNLRLHRHLTNCYRKLLLNLMRSRGNKTHCLRCGPSLSVLLYLPTQKSKKIRKKWVCLTPLHTLAALAKIERLPKTTRPIEKSRFFAANKKYRQY